MFTAKSGTRSTSFRLKLWDEQLGMEGYLHVLLQPLPRAWFHTFTKGLHLLVPPKSNWANPEGLGRAGSCAWWGDLVTH